MARRRRQSVAEDLMDLVAMLPWWGGVALALVTYVCFHALAGRPLPAVTGSAQVGAAVPAMMFKGLAAGLQYFVPAICIVGAVVSYARRRKRQSLLRNSSASEDAGSVFALSWQEFEQLVGEAFRQQGYGVREQGGAGADGGVDLVLTRNGETFLVQCKQWRAFRVGVDVVRELFGVMAARGAAGGFVVTSGQFTDEARKFAEGRNLRLVDGGVLAGMLQRARASAGGNAATDPWVDSRPQGSHAKAPPCPICQSAMVRRTAKKGPAAGSQFWGCSRFPVCRGTR